MADIEYSEISETTRQDLLAATYKLAVKAFQDPAVRARYELWRKEREAALCADKSA